jgi:oligoribonuclease
MNIIESERLRNNKAPKHLVWLDMEMTGLDPKIHRIVEVAVIITDFEFNELFTYEAVIHRSEKVLENSNEFSLFAHTKSGLYDSVRRSRISDIEVEGTISKLIADHVSIGAVYLAGNSIRSDRAFIDAHWKTLSKQLHYRMLDVTSFKLWWLGTGNEAYKKGESHRALDDIRESIAELKFYIAAFKR